MASSMTLKERALAVYRGETPDVVPWFADLSHWYAANSGQEFIPFSSNTWDTGMIDLHKKVNAGVYLNMGVFYDVVFTDNVQQNVFVTDDANGKISHWRLETPIGVIEEQRIFLPDSYSWGMKHRMVQSVDDLKILRYAMERRQFVPQFDRFHKWSEICGNIGLPYASMQYSGLGFLISRGMGIEPTIYAANDAPDEMRRTVDAINENNLQLVDLMATSPAPVIFFSDNFSADVQSPRVIDRWSARYFREVFRRLHAAGKWAAVHIDGRLRGLLKKFAELGADCADAVTPAPMGDLWPRECREDAGPNLILWGGVPPSAWARTASDEVFRKAIMDWLEIRHLSPRLTLAPGDQVPPNTDYYRIEMMAEIVEQHGRY